ncbi:GDYXXLXY domain-containing protein, partial [Candidatus Marithrix sp. Canyon 246]
MRHPLILIIAIIVLAVINFKIYEKEQLLAKGTTVLLKLAPRDPRSLMQGDYMELRYDIVSQPALKAAERDGYLVISIDDKQVANFKRIYEESTVLVADEFLLQFRKRGNDIRLGAESFFF